MWHWEVLSLPQPAVVCPFRWCSNWSKISCRPLPAISSGAFGTLFFTSLTKRGNAACEVCPCVVVSSCSDLLCCRPNFLQLSFSLRTGIPSPMQHHRVIAYLVYDGSPNYSAYTDVLRWTNEGYVPATRTVWLYVSPCPFLFFACSPGTDLMLITCQLLLIYPSPVSPFRQLFFNLFHSWACLPLFSISEERQSRRLKSGNTLLSLKVDWRMEYHLVLPRWISANHIFKLTVAQSQFSNITRGKT